MWASFRKKVFRQIVRADLHSDSFRVGVRGNNVMVKIMRQDPLWREVLETYLSAILLEEKYTKLGVFSIY